MVYMFKNNYRTDVFSPEELEEIKGSIEKELSEREWVDWDESGMGKVYETPMVRIKKDYLGRLEINNLPLSHELRTKVWRIGQEMWQLNKSYPKNISGITYVEYSPKYGKPVLNIHKDNGDCGLILDYQLDSSIDWPFGVEKEIYHLENNSMLAMYPLEHYHWRPEQDWQDNDYVKLIFFEFYTPDLSAEEDEVKKQDIENFISRIAKEKNNEA